MERIWCDLLIIYYLKDKKEKAYVTFEGFAGLMVFGYNDADLTRKKPCT